MRGGSHFLCCCKESNQRKQPIRPLGMSVATRDTPGMEQPLSVALTTEGFLALPWLPPRGADFLGAASFIRLALRARRKAQQKASRSEAFLHGHATAHQRHMLRTRLLLNDSSSERAARGRNGT
jgi:hypothetical protein